MYLLWRGGSLRLRDIAAYFHLGYTAVSMACRRAERQLRSDRRLRAQLRKEGIIDIWRFDTYPIRVQRRYDARRAGIARIGRGEGPRSAASFVRGGPAPKALPEAEVCQELSMVSPAPNSVATAGCAPNCARRA